MSQTSDKTMDKRSDARETFTVEEAIEKIGFGKFQVKVLAMVGFAWSADALEMSLLAILAPAVKCYWNLTHWHEAFLTTIVFIGMFLATYIWGYSSDNYGRRMVLIVSSTGIFLFGLASTFSLNYVILLIFRGMVGACMGGVVQGTTLIVEFLPVATRGLTVNLSSIFFSLGTTIETLMAIYVMPRYGWRVLLFLSAWPSLIFVIVSIIIKYPPESVRFLISSGEKDEAMKVLQQAAKDNKKELPDGEITCQHEVCNRGSLLEMFRNGQWKVTVLLWIIWFASHFNIYGLTLLTTALFSSRHTCYGQPQRSTEKDSCKMLTEEDYKHLFFVLTADFPAVLLIALMADSLGRKWLQAIGFFAMAIFFSLLMLCTSSRSLTTFFLFCVRCFAAVADIGGYIYTPEVYPTHIRGMALGSCSGISRVGCMLTPFVAQVLTHYSLFLSLGTYISVSVVGAVCSLLLPIETKGKGLEEIHRDLQNLKPISDYELLMDERSRLPEQSISNSKENLLESDVHDRSENTAYLTCYSEKLQSTEDNIKYQERLNEKQKKYQEVSDAQKDDPDISKPLKIKNDLSDVVDHEKKKKEITPAEKHKANSDYFNDVLELNKWLEPTDVYQSQTAKNDVKE